MAERPIFSRNRCTSVLKVDDRTMRSTCRLQDTLTDAEVEIDVRLPDLEIVAVRSGFKRTMGDVCREPNEALQKVIGVRVGPGMLKIIKGLVGESSDCGQAAFMVEECCHGIILSFTKETLMQAPLGEELTADHYGEMVRKNIRLYNRCAAFAPGSSMVEGIEPPQ